MRVEICTVLLLHELLVFFDDLDQELAESVGADETYLYELSKQPHYILTGEHVTVSHKYLVERLDNLANQISGEVKVLDCDQGEKRRVEVDFVGHAVDAADEGVSQIVSVALFF